MYYYTCLLCENQFSSKEKIRFYCSKNCFYESRYGGFDHICLYCEKKFRHDKRFMKYCSIKCRSLSQITINESICLQCNKKFRSKKKNPKNCSRVCRLRYSNTQTSKIYFIKNHFEKHVIKNKTGCWGWKGKINIHGYGIVRNMNASRASWLIHNGFDSIPDGLCVLHTCDNRICTNISHLWIGSVHDNVLDMMNKKRNNPTKGSNNYHAKLTEEKIPEIRNRLINEETNRSIALDYNVSEAAISCIKNKKTWRHV